MVKKIFNDFLYSLGIVFLVILVAYLFGVDVKIIFTSKEVIIACCVLMLIAVTGGEYKKAKKKAKAL
ncbi:hypothetical protein JOC36_001744 [Weissella uvarum]|uniref:hypothetical protein n=1 Tax=Weissella uvarum TaxID=1479233 RepID=UPI001960686B|nr:hypothetical protein [Weissella uvarum]MBM7618140.1 hypothetical protein [Weissella uvarum]MCM0595237.1 hypothetical protein [Weissella uvarum]